jgi:CBS domain-containing protein
MAIEEVEQVPSETYVADGQFEEERIMDERAQKPRTLDSTTLRVPISTIEVPEPVMVGPGSPICEAVEAMQKGKFGAVLVAEGGKLVGIFTERDVIAKIAGKGLDWKKVPVKDYMTPRPESLPMNANLAFALNMMTIGGYRHVPIVDGQNCPVGIVSMKDVVRYICGFFEKEVANLPPRPNLVKPRKVEDG